MDLSAATKLQAWLREDTFVVPEDTLPALRALARDYIDTPKAQRELERDLTRAAVQLRVDELTQGGLSRTQAVRAAAIEAGVSISAAWSYIHE